MLLFSHKFKLSYFQAFYYKSESIGYTLYYVCNSFYTLMLILLKRYKCFCYGLKMRMCLIWMLLQDVRTVLAFNAISFYIQALFYDFLVTVKAAPHECVIGTAGQP